MSEKEIKTCPPISALEWAEADSQKRTGGEIPAWRAPRDSSTECLNGSEIRNWKEAILKPGRGTHAQTCVFCCSLVESLRSGKVTVEQAFENLRQRIVSRPPPLQSPEEQHARLASVIRKDQEKKRETTKRVNPPGVVGKFFGSITGIFNKKDLGR